MGIYVVTPTLLLQRSREDLKVHLVANAMWTTIHHEDGNGTRFDLRSGSDHIASFELALMPGCPNICISYGAWVSNEFRGRGIGTYLHDLRQQIAKYWGCQLMLATDDRDNAHQSKILKRKRWKTLLEFDNYISGHKVALRTKRL